MDLGCGAGENISALKKLGATSGMGVDFCAINIKKGRKLVKDTNFIFIHGNMQDLRKFNKNKFDLIISVFSICFISEIAKFVRNISKVSNNGTLLIIATDHPDRILYQNNNPNNKDDLKRHKVRRWKLGNLHTHECLYVHNIHSLNLLRSSLEDNNFKLITILEPFAVPNQHLNEVPYSSEYFINRYEELASCHYTIILKAEYIKK